MFNQSEQEILYFHIKKTGRKRKALLKDLKNSLSFFEIGSYEFFDNDVVRDYTLSNYQSVIKKLEKSNEDIVTIKNDVVRSTF